MKVLIELDDLTATTLARIARETKDSAVLDKLAESKSKKVLIAVAGNEFTPPITVAANFFFHKDQEVRSAARESKVFRI